MAQRTCQPDGTLALTSRLVTLRVVYLLVRFTCCSPIGIVQIYNTQMTAAAVRGYKEEAEEAEAAYKRKQVCALAGRGLTKAAYLPNSTAPLLVIMSCSCRGHGRGDCEARHLQSRRLRHTEHHVCWRWRLATHCHDAPTVSVHYLHVQYHALSTPLRRRRRLAARCRSRWLTPAPPPSRPLGG